MNNPGDHLRRFLPVFASGAEQLVIELRALGVPQKWGGPKVECGFFSFVACEKPEAFVKALNSLATRDPEMQPEGIYVTLNPVNPALLARSDNRLKTIRDKPISASDADVIGRRWLLVDVDPKRPGGISATDEEKAAARLVFDGVREDLRARGWPDPMVNDSGNGFHGWYRIDLPRDDKKQVEHALKALAARHNCATVTIDTSVYNPSRIVKVPGTWARKGDSVPDRPHRMAMVLEVPDTIEIVPGELIEALAAQHATPSQTPATPPVQAARRAGRFKVSAGGNNAVKRCAAYLAKIDPAISGNNGHDQTYQAARIIWNDFGIEKVDGWPLLLDFNSRCQPSWSEKELQHKWDDAVEKGPGPEGRGFKLHEQNGKHTNGVHKGRIHSAPAPQFDDTDIANGRRFTDDHGEDVRYVADWGKWLVYDGQRWQIDRSETLVERLAKETADRMAEEADERVRAIQVQQADEEGDEGKAKHKAALKNALAALAHAKATADMRSIRRMLQAARSERDICIPDGGKVFDTRRDLLNCPNGTVELRTAAFREHRREDYITRLCPTKYDPNAPRDTYFGFLKSTFSGKPEIAQYVRDLSGCIATGEVSDQTLNIAHGEGSNGKNVLFDTWKAVLGEGEYAHSAAAELLVGDGWDRHPTEKTGLRGARLVICSETGEDGQLDETKMKALTGGDTVTARYMRQDFFQFEPTHKLILLTNNKPRVRGTDHGIWRRIRLVPFKVKFWKPADMELNPAGDFREEFRADPTLGERLRTIETQGILADMVEHAVAFYRNGGTLQPPADVLNETAEYRKAEDVIGQFFDARVKINPEGKVKASVFYTTFKRWWEGEGFPPTKVPSPTRFGREAKRRFTHEKPHGVTYQIEFLPEPKTENEDTSKSDGSEGPRVATVSGLSIRGTRARAPDVHPENGSNPRNPRMADDAFAELVNSEDPADVLEREAIREHGGG